MLNNITFVSFNRWRVSQIAEFTSDCVFLQVWKTRKFSWLFQNSILLLMFLATAIRSWLHIIIEFKSLITTVISYKGCCLFWKKIINIYLFYTHALLWSWVIWVSESGSFELQSSYRLRETKLCGLGPSLNDVRSLGGRGG